MTRPPQIPNREPPTIVKAAVPQHCNKVSTLFNTGLTYHQKGQLTQAQQFYAQVLVLQPDHFNATHLSGVIALQSKNPSLALELIGKALVINPNSADAYTHRGNALQELKLVEEALASYDKAIEIKPDHSLAYSNRGNALKQLKRMEEALVSYDAAIAIKPDHADSYSNRGTVLRELKRFEEAVASYDKAIEINPEHPQAHYNRGKALKELIRIEEALASYDKAIQIKPDLADAYWNKSLTLLLAGELIQGWKLYEWGWKNNHRGIYRDFFQPLWLGLVDISGKTILLHSEQGLGDTIQFCRYVKLIKELGAKVLLEVPKPLMGLLHGLEGVDQLIECGKPLPDFEYHCPLMSLPLAFKTELVSIPNPTPYLVASPQKCNEWAQRLGAKTKPLVGLVWSGSTEHKNDHNRSLTLQLLSPCLSNLFEYVSLQKELREKDKQRLSVCDVKHYEDEIKDFSDTAAICELMDLVISVDTSVAHLAGAIGKKTWVLLPYAPDWRWLLHKDYSPWYQSIKIYRQPSPGDWDSVTQRVRQDLIEYSNNWKF
jgi:tetratricopeptide (TPR) repeat protein/ADP-heptose:LPS heptosyltransferase